MKGKYHKEGSVMRLLQNIHNLDVQTFSWCLRRKHHQFAVWLSRGISYTANGPFYVLAGLSFMLAEHWELVKLLALGFVLERTLYFIFKNLFHILSRILAVIVNSFPFPDLKPENQSLF